MVGCVLQQQHIGDSRQLHGEYAQLLAIQQKIRTLNGIIIPIYQYWSFEVVGDGDGDGDA